MKREILFLSFLLIFIVGCTNDSPDDLFVPIVVPITYDEHIRPVVNERCIVCHTNPPENGAPMPLLTYENVKEAVQNRKLINKISSENPDNGERMPFGGPYLNENTINLFIQWEADGLLENFEN